jgi:predicted acetyltransferase
MFSTVGNVATHPDFEGRGYMKILMKEAMAELDRIGADASRLGGLRARYARYGYEMCGTQYRLIFTPHNLKNYYPDFIPNLTFEPIAETDYEALEYCCTLYEKQPFYVLRGREDNYRKTFMSMIAWQNIPYLIKKDGKSVGFLSMKGDEIAEIFTERSELYKEAILSLTAMRGSNVVFYLRPHNVSELREFSRTAENITIQSPSRFKIINYKKVINALLKLKANIHPLTDADFTIDIEDYGKLRIISDDDGTRCVDYDGECDITLSRNNASRLLFGPLPDYAVADISEKTGNLLPLPLSWNLQDRA